MYKVQSLSNFNGQELGKIRDIKIADDRNDSIKINEVDIATSYFLNLGLKNADLNKTRITQSIIENCYLRSASFSNVDFTGTKFINCNLEKATFKICNLRYVEFIGCKLNIDEVMENLPSESNLRLAVLKQLYINQDSIRDKKSCDRILKLILQEERRTLKCILTKPTSYYKDIDFLKWVRTLIEYLKNCLNDFVWGHGLSIPKLMRTAIIIVVGYAVLYFFMPVSFIDEMNSNSILLNFPNALIYSTFSFVGSTASGFITNSFLGKLLHVSENFLGLLVLGCFISALYRRITR